MALYQPARDDVRLESIAEWMERRRREVAARGPDAEPAGRAAWAAGGLNGEPLYAPSQCDVVALGARVLLKDHGAERVDPVGGCSNLDIATGPGQTNWPPARTQIRPLAYQPNPISGRTSPSETARPSALQDDEMTRLRREQTAFKEVVREESRRNSWMAIPALAPLAVPIFAEGAALLTGRLAAPQFSRSPLNFLQQESTLAPKSPLARPGPTVRPSPKPRAEVEENAIRRAARDRYARAYGGRASDWAGQVHHRVALRFRELFPNADPNRLANLQALEEEAHLVVTRATAAWVRGLGRVPTQAEVMAHTLRMDKLVEPYILRAGVPRPPPIPKR